MTQIKLRRDTSAAFASSNPILGNGEPAYETDTKKLKIGDGTTAYTQLAYFSTGGGGSTNITATLPLKIVDGVISLEVDNQTIQIVDGKLHANLDELGNEVNSLTGEVTDLSGRVTAVEANLDKKENKITTTGALSLQEKIQTNAVGFTVTSESAMTNDHYQRVPFPESQSSRLCIQDSSFTYPYKSYLAIPYSLGQVIRVPRAYGQLFFGSFDDNGDFIVSIGFNTFYHNTNGFALFGGPVYRAVAGSSEYPPVMPKLNPTQMGYDGNYTYHTPPREAADSGNLYSLSNYLPENDFSCAFYQISPDTTGAIMIQAFWSIETGRCSTAVYRDTEASYQYAGHLDDMRNNIQYALWLPNETGTSYNPSKFGLYDWNVGRIPWSNADGWKAFFEGRGANLYSLTGQSSKNYLELNLGDGLSVVDGKLTASGGGSGLEICDIGMALYVDETKGLRRYLNGQIVDINTNTQAFLNRLKEITTLHPSLLCTEEEWQTAKTMSAFGQVGKFVFNYSGNKIVSVRIPRVVNVQGLFDLQNLGMTVAESLPNITGNAGDVVGDHSGQSGALYISGSGTAGFNGGSIVWRKLGFDASRSSTTYQDGAPVQPEAIQYPYFIQIATGQETENNIINDIELNNPYSLFDSKYSDHELNNLSWLKSEGQWNAKAVYPTAYDKLLKVYNGTETVEGLSVKLSTETYTDYDFVLNTADETFRLPLLNGDEKFIDTSIVKILVDHWTSNTQYTAPVNCMMKVSTQTSATGQYIEYYKNNVFQFNRISANNTEESNDQIFLRKGETLKINTNYGGTKGAIKYSPAVGNGTLYYYVGESVQNANLIDAGRIGEQLADKIGRTECKAYITETYVKGKSGYRLYSDKYIEQWGAVNATHLTMTVSFLKSFKDTNYNFVALGAINTNNGYYKYFVGEGSGSKLLYTGRTTSSCVLSAESSTNWKANWMVTGYIA